MPRFSEVVLECFSCTLDLSDFRRLPFRLSVGQSGVYSLGFIKFSSVDLVIEQPYNKQVPNASWLLEGRRLTFLFFVPAKVRLNARIRLVGRSAFFSRASTSACNERQANVDTIGNRFHSNSSYTGTLSCCSYNWSWWLRRKYAVHKKY